MNTAKETLCPACGTPLGVTADPQKMEKVPAGPGDVGICLHCYTILRYEEGGRVRVATQLEIDLLPVSLRTQVVEYQEFLRREGIGGDLQDKGERLKQPGEAGYLRLESVPKHVVDWPTQILKNRDKYEGQHGHLVEMKESALIAYASDPTTLAIIIEMGRKGAQVFMHGLEYEVFPPRHPAKINSALEVFPWTWEKKHWAVLLIPMTARSEAERIAALYGMVLYDGTPMCCRVKSKVPIFMVGNTRASSNAAKEWASRGALTWFPIKGDNAYTLENAPGHTPPEKAEEEALINFILSEWEAKYPPNE